MSGWIDVLFYLLKIYLVEIVIEKRVEVVVYGGDRVDGICVVGDVCCIVDIYFVVLSRGGYMVCFGRLLEGVDGVFGFWRESNIGV